MNPARPVPLLPTVSRILTLLALAVAMTGCRSDNLWFNDSSPKLGLAGADSHVPRLEREWRANDPASHR